MSNFKEAGKAEFYRLSDEYDALAEQRRPAREAYDALAEQISALVAQQKEYAQIFLPIELQMSEISNAKAAIVRLLDGKIGERVIG